MGEKRGDGWRNGELAARKVEGSERVKGGVLGRRFAAKGMHGEEARRGGEGKKNLLFGVRYLTKGEKCCTLTG